MFYIARHKEEIKNVLEQIQTAVSGIDKDTLREQLKVHQDELREVQN